MSTRMNKIPQFVRREFASIIAGLALHVQLDIQGKSTYFGQRYVAPPSNNWLRHNYIQLMLIILCWFGLLSNKSYWDGLRTEMTYEINPDGVKLRDQYFPIQTVPNKDEVPTKNIFNGNIPGVGTAHRFVKDTEQPSA